MPNCLHDMTRSWPRILASDDITTSTQERTEYVLHPSTAVDVDHRHLGVPDSVVRSPLCLHSLTHYPTVEVSVNESQFCPAQLDKGDPTLLHQTSNEPFRATQAK